MLMVMGVVAFSMVTDKRQRRNGSKGYGSEGGGKDKRERVMGQRKVEGDYEERKDGGKSIVDTEGRMSKGARQGSNQQ